MFLTRNARRLFFLLFITGLLPSAMALELGLDVSYSGSTQNEDWGASSHLQIMGAQGFGLDFGFQYLNSLSYEAFDTPLSHSLSQYETSVLWQGGQQNFRIQGIAGTVFSNGELSIGSNEVIKQWAPGYKLGAGVSVPVFTRFRAFAEADFQGWFNAEIPAHFNWRYGVRLLFGGNSIKKLEAQEQQEAEQQAQRMSNQAVNSEVMIDPEVPVYVPGYLSQSLPPIIRQAELCKCYPAGPYTLQLGEFSNMAQAIRALEYRGLRQFFNSRAYQKHPLPVFLAQEKVDAPVGLYLGELDSVEQMQHWRYELRKSGMEAQFRKIIGSDGERVANPVVVALGEAEQGLKPKYSAEEIRRMNSLPEDYMPSTSAGIAPLMAEGEKTVADIVREKEAYEANLQQRRELMNQVEQVTSEVHDVLQIGPLPLQRLQALLEDSAMKDVLSRNNSIQIPSRLSLTWDEMKQEAWLTCSGFANEAHIDEWQAWFTATDIPAKRSEQPYLPLGDVYDFALAQPLEKYSVEIAREESIQIMLQQMRSPEVLWFQAYQRINDQPLQTSLNWSETDRRYHLIVTNVTSQREQQQVWTNLNAVGLLPSLAED
ncbi:MAG: hypothetical protein P8X74_10380 [Reinekea sp.]|jgi:hypothetical protein